MFLRSILGRRPDRLLAARVRGRSHGPSSRRPRGSRSEALQTPSTDTSRTGPTDPLRAGAADTPRTGTADTPRTGTADSDEQALTALLRRSSAGDAEASERVVALLYHELHRLARAHMRGQKRAHSLQPTALVNEAFLRLFRDGAREYNDREHFLALASRAMRTVLVDHARAKGRQKRRGSGERIPLEALVADYSGRAIDLLALDDALERLTELDPDLTRLVELRFFGGLTMPEAADQIGWPLRRAEREWQTARAWLRRNVEGRGT